MQHSLQQLGGDLPETRLMFACVWQGDTVTQLTPRCMAALALVQGFVQWCAGPVKRLLVRVSDPGSDRRLPAEGRVFVGKQSDHRVN